MPNTFNIINKIVHVKTPLGEWVGIPHRYSPGSILLEVQTKDGTDMVQILSQEIVITLNEE